MAYAVKRASAPTTAIFTGSTNVITSRFYVKNFGVVHFDPHYDASTRIHIHMFYRPPAGILGRVFAEAFGADAGQVLDQDLKRLKYLFEKLCHSLCPI